MATLSLIFSGRDEVAGASKQVAGDLKDVGKAADEAKSSGTGFFGGMLQAASGFLAANLIGAISSQIGGFVSSAFEDARGTQQLMAATNQIITNTGGAAGMSAQQVADLASSLSDAAGQSLFGDDQIQGAENVLLKYKELKGIIPGVTTLAVDMAQNLGKEPAAAAEFLGRALQKPFDATAKLAKEGIVLNDQQQAMLATFKATNDVTGAQQYLMEQLNGTFGGSAKAAADSAGGMVQFKARMGEMAEGLAASLLPTLDKLGGLLVTYVAPAIETAATWLGQNLPTAIDFVSGAIDGIIGMFASAGDSSNELSGVISELGDTWNLVKEIIDLAAELINATVVPTFQSIAAFLGAHSTEIKAILTAAWTIIKVTIDTVLTVIKGLIKVALQLIQGDWAGAWETIKQTLSHVWDNIKVIVQSAVDIVKNELSMAWDAIKDKAGQAWDGLVELIKSIPARVAGAGEAIVQTIWDGIQAKWQQLVDWFNEQLQKLKDKLPFSEPKDASSPLRGLGKAGEAIVTNIQQGIGAANPLNVGAPLIGGSMLGRVGSGGGGTSISTSSRGGDLHFHIDARGSAMQPKQFEDSVRRVLDASGNKALSRIRTGG
jgi:hypothetical protein